MAATLPYPGTMGEVTDLLKDLAKDAAGAARARVKAATMWRQVPFALLVGSYATASSGPHTRHRSESAWLKSDTGRRFDDRISRGALRDAARGLWLFGFSSLWPAERVAIDLASAEFVCVSNDKRRPAEDIEVLDALMSEQTSTQPFDPTPLLDLLPHIITEVDSPTALQAMAALRVTPNWVPDDECLSPYDDVVFRLARRWPGTVVELLSVASSVAVHEDPALVAYLVGLADSWQGPVDDLVAAAGLLVRNDPAEEITWV